MKKISFSLLLLSLITLQATAQSVMMMTNFGISRAYEAVSLENTKNSSGTYINNVGNVTYASESYGAMNSLGADFQMYLLDEDEGFGFFLQFSTYFPLSARLGPDSSTKKTTYANYSRINKLGGIFGLAANMRISDQLSVLFGTGLHIMLFSCSYEQYYSGYGYKDHDVDALNLGIGSNLIINHYLDDEVFIYGGMSFIYDFANFTTTKKHTTTTDYTPGSYSFIIFNPQIGIGVFLE